MNHMPRGPMGGDNLNPEKVAYWYFRLNGFLQIENFVIHPSQSGAQRTGHWRASKNGENARSRDG